MLKAFSLYRKIGFTVTRKFNYFVWKNEVSEDNSTNTNALYPIELINLDEYDAIPNFWDFSPAWQNSFEFNRRTKKTLSIQVYLLKENS